MGERQPRRGDHVGEMQPLQGQAKYNALRVSSTYPRLGKQATCLHGWPIPASGSAGLSLPSAVIYKQERTGLPDRDPQPPWHLPELDKLITQNAASGFPPLLGSRGAPVLLPSAGPPCSSDSPLSSSLLEPTGTQQCLSALPSVLRPCCSGLAGMMDKENWGSRKRAWQSHGSTEPRAAVSDPVHRHAHPL